jgi:predicted lipid-binding transport protein (Tim44 family)
MARRTAASVALSFALIAWLPGSERPVMAQEQTPRRALTSRAFVWPRAVDSRVPLFSVEELLSKARRKQPGASADNVTNGALIGALVGGLGLGAFGAFICHLHQGEGGASCLKDMIRLGAIGAAIGMGVGVAVDAALTSNAGVAVRIRVDF